MRWIAGWGAALGLACTCLGPTGAAASHQAYYGSGAAPSHAGEAFAGRVQTDFWSSLTPEQQAIHGAVSQLYRLYFERQGEVIPVSRETVALVMRELDIAAEHADWTAYVMQLNVQRLRTAREAGFDAGGMTRDPRP